MNDPEKNRMKVTKFRTRKGLKEAGYGDDEIKSIFAGIAWADVTPVDVLSLYTATVAQELPRANGSRPPTRKNPTTHEPRQTSQAATQEEPEESGLPAWVGNTIAIGVLLCLALYIFSTIRATQ